MTKIDDLKAEALDEARSWLEAHSDEYCEASSPLDCQRSNIEGTIRDLVPCMTTTLFALVVETNNLAFRDIDTGLGDDTPFSALTSAVGDELVEYVFATLEAEQAEEDNDN